MTTTEQPEPITAHRISNDGQSIVCESTRDAYCRMTPNCDSETWDRDGGCHEHQEVIDGHQNPNTGHPVTPGGDCWMANGHLNPVPLSNTYGNFYEDGEPTIYPGRAVEIEFHGTDAGCTWDYTETM